MKSFYGLFLIILGFHFWGYPLMADITSQTLQPSLNHFYNTIEDAQLWLGTEKEKDYSLIFVGQFNTVDTPIVGDDGTGKNKSVVKRTSSLQLGSSWLIAPKTEIGANFALNSVQAANGNSYFGIGDIHLMAKRSLLQKPNDWGLSFAPDFYVPIHNDQPFISNGSFGFGGRFFLEKNFGKFNLALNGGYLRLPSAHYSVIQYSTQFPTGFGIRIPVGQKVSINIEGTSSILLNTSLTNSIGDFYVGTKISIFNGGILNVGGAYGKIKVDNSSSVRVIAGLDVLPFMTEPIKTVTKEKEVHTFRDCTPKSYVMQLKARNITESEKHRLKEFPFIESESFKTTQLGVATGKTKNGVSYNQSSQMIFAIDLDAMPLKEDLVSIDSLSLKMKVNKLVQHDDLRSGMLCLVKEKICSGDLPNNEKQRANVNHLFFEDKEPPNDYFTRSIQGTEKDGIITSQVVLPLQKVLENSVAPDVLDLIYDHSGVRRDSIYFAAAPDIYILKNVEIETTVTISTCVTSDTITVDGI